MKWLAVRLRTIVASQLTWIVVILVLGVILRFYRLGDMPPGMNQDEASTAYDAYSIAFYGIDRNGYHLPLYLVGWGDGMSALPAYLLVPFYYVFGVSVFTARLLAATVGSLSIVLAYGVGLYAVSKRQGLITAFFVAISPWHILQSRWLFEAEFLPFMFLVGLCCQLCFFRTDRTWVQYASAACFALTLYTYGPAFLFIPVYVLLSFTYLLWQKFSRWKTVIGSAVLFGLVAFPFAYYIGVQSRIVPEVRSIVSIPLLPSTPRYEVATGAFSPESAIRRVRWLGDMLYQQNDGLIYNVIPEFGIMYVGAGVLALLGLGAMLYLLWYRKERAIGFIVAWFIAALLLGAALDPNINRVNIAVLLMVILCSLAVGTILQRRILLVPVIGFYCIFCTQFAEYYFQAYPDRVGPGFFESFNQALELVPDDTSIVCVTGNVNMPHIFALFVGRVDPWLYVRSLQGADDQDRNSYSRYVFGLGACTDPAIRTFVLTNEEADQMDSFAFSRITLKRFSVLTRRDLSL